MKKQLSYISNRHLTKCISNLHNSYLEAQSKIDKSRFYRNKIDTFKLLFDSNFAQIDEKMLIKAEISRQIDKSVNNAIGYFHEEILGGINGYQQYHLSGYDIKADDNSLFADIKNKHNTMNSSSSESLFWKLKNIAEKHPKAKCYWVQILAKNSFCEKWEATINGKKYSHNRVFKISGDKFYSLLSGKSDALFQLYQALPKAISDFIKQNNIHAETNRHSVLTEILKEISLSKKSILDQITSDNFDYYDGFDKLK
ncbi:MAG: Eco47II family restriction endonuclease [Chlorobi bacterium]|nr:Eco47II family restriction endonuclease [Chlorobiota bacterium]